LKEEIMLRPFVMMVSIGVAATLALAASGSDVSSPALTMTSDRVTVTVRMPAGWSAAAGRIQPPAEFRQACEVRAELDSTRGWDRTLAAGLEPADLARLAKEHRALFRLSGHVAVRNWYINTAGRTVEGVYINLEDVSAGSVATWTFEGDHTAEGQRCRMEFGRFSASAKVAPPEPDR
jgi:hypothetical protein